MRKISVADARRELPAMLDALERGEIFHITRHGRVVGELRQAEDVEPTRDDDASAGTLVVAGFGAIDVTERGAAAIAAQFATLPTIHTPIGSGDHLIARDAIDHLFLPKRGDTRLTRREREIAVLISEGLTNRDIAERLVLSERTVEGHIANVNAKLSVTSRTQLATYVMRNMEVMRRPRFAFVTRAGYSYQVASYETFERLQAALGGDDSLLLRLDVDGGMVFVPPSKIAAVEIRHPSQGDDGFVFEGVARD